VGRALQEFGDVEVVVVDAEGGGEEWAERANKDFNVAYSVPVETRLSKRWSEKLRWVMDPRVDYPHGCGVRREALERVLQTAHDFDLIWFCKLRTPNMFPHWAWQRSVVDIDDIPSTYEQSVQRIATKPLDRLLSAARVFSWRRRDRLLGDRFTILGVCSETDKQYLERLGVSAPIYTIPNGFEQPTTTPVRIPVVPPRIGFIGIFDYEPNVSGIRWFVNECWPRIKRGVPDARLRLMGRYSDGPLVPAGPDIDGLGWVPNAADEIATWSGMIVPILLGAGTRGKIAHAFSLKCPVISTSLGAYGYGTTNGKEMFLADSSEDFANACVRVLRHPAEAAEIAERAWREFVEKWTWEVIRPRIWAAAEHCLRLTAGSR
jgi:glycosyltransferase involved in cell wall biosynthesis